jgi:U6 snRNA-associated Sm-like protein LSm1
MMQDTIERIYVNKLFCDIPRGVFVIRGENVEMIGEIVWSPSHPSIYPI